MNKKYLIIVFMTLFAVSADAQFLFQIRGGGLEEPSYMLGTFHSLPGSLLDSIPEYIEAEARCRQLYAEMNMTNPQEMADMMHEFSEAVILPEGLTIGKLLTKKQFRALNNRMETLYHRSLNPTAHIKPIVYIMMILRFWGEEAMKMFPALDNSGEVDMTRIDAICVERASKRGMTVGSLDEAGSSGTPELFGLSMGIDEQVDSLVRFLRHYEANRQGCIDAYKLMAEETDCWMKGDYDRYVETCFSHGNTALTSHRERNEKWLPKMKSAMNDAPTMFVFGAGHLAGEHGIIQLLRDAGYQIEPIKKR